MFALLSVADKTGLEALAGPLVAAGLDLLASGGTAHYLQQQGFTVTEVADYTGSPEILGGRVKTLHPRIHGGILARLDQRTELEQAGISPIAVVVVNLYPFAQTIAQPEVTESEAIEQIDIGGVALIRAAAKNFTQVSVLTHPDQYPDFSQHLTQGLTESYRRTLAQQAFAYTSSYDQTIAQWFAGEGRLPETLNLHLTRHQPLRYGENPHQPATWYRQEAVGFTTARILQGKELSFNNLVDLEAARRLVARFAPLPCAVIIKHTNPCGVALGITLAAAYHRAYTADSVSAFGGIVGLSQPVDEATAQQLVQTFLECVLAPDFSPEALAILQRKPQLRLLALPDLTTAPPLDFKAISGGLLVQATATQPDDPAMWQVVTQRRPTPDEWRGLSFAWEVVQQVKSNAIVLTRDQQTLGIGVGQTNRVGSAQLALAQAGSQAQGAVLASDGFFPFDDTVRLAARHGVQALIQPGGSKRDSDSIAACDELGLTMVMTGTRHFLH